jgi:hypothetical protein
MDDKIIDKLKKINALAERGFAGEAKAAKRQLEKLMEKYGLTIDDIMDEKKTERVFKVPRAMDQLFVQVLTSVISDRFRDVWNYRGETTLKRIDLTDMEFVDIEQSWSFHSKQLKKEIAKSKKLLESAYYQKHDLFNCNPKESNSKGSKLSLKELEALFRMMDNLESVTLHKQLV